MAAMPPPLSIAWVIHRRAPTLWAAFFRAASEGLLAGSTVTSWWRSPDTNRRAGASSESQHLVALAFDAVHADADALQASLSQAGFIAVPSGRGSIHAQVFPAGLLRRAGVLRELGL